MNFGNSLTMLVALFSLTSFAQTELTITKFRFRKHTSANFERLVLEFSGPAVEEEVESKATASGTDQDVSLLCKNVQLVGVIPESTINDGLQKSRKLLGPISINTDMPKNGFSLRTLLKNSEAQVDAFWLSKPTRLVVDVYPKSSPRASSRNVVDMNRNVASEKATEPKLKKNEKKSGKNSEGIFCFPSNAKMGASVAFAPWRGSNLVPMDVKDPSSAQNEMKDGVVCYPAQSRLHPQVSFTNGEMEKAADEPVLEKQSSAPAPQAVKETKDSAKSSLLPAIETTEEPRALASEPARQNPFEPKTKNGPPPSLGTNFEKSQKGGANPASLLPPFR